MTDTQEGWTTEEVDAAWVEEVDEGWAEWEGDYEYVRQGRSRLKLAVTFLFAILLVGLLVVGGLSLWVVRQINPPGDPGAKLTVTIDPGATTSEIADLLETRGVITNAAVFRWYVSYKKAGPFSPGYYEMRKRSSMGDVVKVLETPPPITFTNVTFPEGLTLDRFAARLAEKAPRLTAEKFMAAAQSGQLRSKYEPADVNNLEGLLFPDTYQVASNEDEAKVIARLIAQMEKVATEEGVDYAPFKLNLSSLPGAHDRLDHRERGEDRRGPPEDRPRHLQPPRAGHEPRDRRNRHLRDGWQRRAAHVRRHQQHELAVQHLQEPGAATRPDRDAWPRLDQGGDEPRRRPVALLCRRRQGRQPRIRQDSAASTRRTSRSQSRTAFADRGGTDRLDPSRRR